MNILFLSAWCPLPADNGVRLRLANLLRGLARHHEIHLLTFAPEAPGDAALRELRAICAEVELVAESPFAGHPVDRLAGLLSPAPRSLLANHSPAMAAAVRLRARQTYDLVLAAELHMVPYALALPGPRVLEDLEIAVIRDQYHRQTNPARRTRAYLTWWKLAGYLRRILPEFAAVTVASQPELDMLRQLAPPNLTTALVPNGVDLAGYAGNYGAPAPDSLIYPGSLAFEPNLDAVRYFAHDILPRVREVRPQARLLVTGRATPEQRAALGNPEGVELLGHLPDVRPAIAQAWAEVVPLRRGSGTRLKILEALALGTPVVATSKGAEGLALEPERDLLIADSPSAFATQVLRVLASAELRGRLAARGRAAVTAYDWSSGVARLEQVIDAARAATA